MTKLTQKIQKATTKEVRQAFNRLMIWIDHPRFSVESQRELQIAEEYMSLACE